MAKTHQSIPRSEMILNKGLRQPISQGNLVCYISKNTVNYASRVKFPFPEFNQNEDLVVTIVKNFPVAPTLEDEVAITKVLYNINIFSFSLAMDILIINIVINSILLKDEDRRSEDWLQAVCKFFKEDHNTKEYSYSWQYCMATCDKTYSNMIYRCINSNKTSHFTGNLHCSTRITARSPVPLDREVYG
ncbi:hypothetical protein HOY80DRAFT_1002639 [Tuber brumale]|nr:hypothetical protein HOY80DRAFT_1002639 [Tuber brumale]